jgi:hypothetical protein
MSDLDDRKTRRITVQSRHDGHDDPPRLAQALQVVISGRSCTRGWIPFTPHIVTSQDSKLLREGLNQEEIRLGRSFNVMAREEPDASSELFAEQLRRACPEYAAHCGSLAQPPDEETILPMDNVQPHLTTISSPSESTQRIPDNDDGSEHLWRFSCLRIQIAWIHQ